MILVVLGILGYIFRILCRKVLTISLSTHLRLINSVLMRAKTTHERSLRAFEIWLRREHSLLWIVQYFVMRILLVIVFVSELISDQFRLD